MVDRAREGAEPPPPPPQSPGERAPDLPGVGDYPRASVLEVDLRGESPHVWHPLLPRAGDWGTFRGGAASGEGPWRQSLRPQTELDSGLLSPGCRLGSILSVGRRVWAPRILKPQPPPAGGGPSPSAGRRPHCPLPGFASYFQYILQAQRGGSGAGSHLPFSLPIPGQLGGSRQGALGRPPGPGPRGPGDPRGCAPGFPSGGLPLGGPRQPRCGHVPAAAGGAQA